MTSAAGRATGGASGRRARGGVGRVEVRRVGRELGRAGVDHRVARPKPQREPRRPQVGRGRAGQPGQLAVAEAGALDASRAASAASGSAASASRGAHRAHVRLERDVPAHLREEPGRDAGRLADDRLGDAAPQQAEEAPEPAVGRLEEPPEDDRGGRPLGMASGFAGLAGLVDPADRLVRIGIARVDRREIVEGRRPGRVLGQRPDARLLEPAQRLVQRRPEGPVDRHHLARRLHLAAERPVGAGELVEREARQLDHDVVERRLERGHGRAGHDVRDLGEAAPDGDLRRDPGDRVAGRLRGERRRARDARVDLDHRVLGRVGRERELDVAAALDPERADDRQRGAAQPLVDRVGQRLDRRDDDRVAGVDPERVDVLHRAHGDAGVVRVAHDLVLDLLPADEAALDHHLVDGARAQTGADAFAVGRLGLDDAAARPAERERGPDDRRQADLGEPVSDVPPRRARSRSSWARTAGRSGRAGRGTPRGPRPSGSPRGACRGSGSGSARRRRPRRGRSRGSARSGRRGRRAGPRAAPSR